jgi:hypothetical protein
VRNRLFPLWISVYCAPGLLRIIRRFLIAKVLRAEERSEKTYLDTVGGRAAAVAQFMRDANMPVPMSGDRWRPAKTGGGTTESSTVPDDPALTTAGLQQKTIDIWAKPVRQKPMPQALGTHFALEEDDELLSSVDADMYAAAREWNEDRMLEDSSTVTSDDTSRLDGGFPSVFEAPDTLLDGCNTQAYTQRVTDGTASVMDTCVMDSDGAPLSLFQRQHARTHAVGGREWPNCPNRGIALHAFSCPTCCE